MLSNRSKTWGASQKKLPTLLIPEFTTLDTSDTNVLDEGSDVWFSMNAAAGLIPVPRARKWVCVHSESWKTILQMFWLNG